MRAYHFHVLRSYIINAILRFWYTTTVARLDVRRLLLITYQRAGQRPILTNDSYFLTPFPKSNIHKYNLIFYPPPTIIIKVRHEWVESKWAKEQQVIDNVWEIQIVRMETKLSEENSRIIIMRWWSPNRVYPRDDMIMAISEYHHGLYMFQIHHTQRERRHSKKQIY